MDIMAFFANIWDVVMTILLNAGVAVENWKNPFVKE